MGFKNPLYFILPVAPRIFLEIDYTFHRLRDFLQEHYKFGVLFLIVHNPLE
nr:MAG TPA: hypothetical protein [Caudoviricetes sp.]